MSEVGIVDAPAVNEVKIGRRGGGLVDNNEAPSSESGATGTAHAVEGQKHSPDDAPKVGSRGRGGVPEESDGPEELPPEGAQASSIVPGVTKDTSGHTPEAAPHAPSGVDINAKPIVTDDNGLPLRAETPDSLTPSEDGSNGPVGSNSLLGGAKEAAADPDSRPVPDKEKDPLQLEEPIDPLHAALMSLLMAPRLLMRQELSAKIADCNARRDQGMNALAQMAAQAAAPQDPKAQGRGGSSILGSLASRLGRDPASAAAAAAKLAFDNTKAAVDKIEFEAREVAAKRKLICDMQYKQTLRAANVAYKTHIVLGAQIEAFNAKFDVSPKGIAFNEYMDAVAQARQCTRAELRDAIHDVRETSPYLVEARKHVNSICADKEFASELAAIEENARILRVSMESLHSGLSSAADNNMDISSLDGDLADVMSKMKVPDCSLARPKGEPVDGMGKELAEQAEKISKMIADFFGRAFGGSKTPKVT